MISFNDLKMLFYCILTFNVDTQKESDSPNLHASPLLKTDNLFHSDIFILVSARAASNGPLHRDINIPGGGNNSQRHPQ